MNRFEPKLLRNAARCNACEDEIESKSVHHFVKCKCGALFVDGGLEYVRRGYSGKKGFDDLCVYEVSL